MCLGEKKNPLKYPSIYASPAHGGMIHRVRQCAETKLHIRF